MEELKLSIKEAKNCLKAWYSPPKEKGKNGDRIRQRAEVALQMALNALNSTAPENKPLTLDQLRKMDGEPVWINNINSPTRSGWNLVWVGEGDTFVIAADGWKIPLDCLGTRIPYARKPEQEEQP